MKTIKSFLAVALVLGSTIVAGAQSGPKVIAEGVPDGWHIGSIGGVSKTADRCTVERGFKRILSDRCTSIGNGGKRCMWDCVPISGRTAEK